MRSASLDVTLSTRAGTTLPPLSLPALPALARGLTIMDDDQQRSPLTSVFLAVTLGLGAYLTYTMFTGEDPPPQTPTQTAPVGGEDTRSCRDAVGEEETAEIVTDDYRAVVSSLGGLKSFELLQDRYLVEGAPDNVVTTDKCEYYPFRLELPGLPIDPAEHWVVDQRSPREVELRWSGSGVEVVRTLTAGDGPYQLWSAVTVSNTGDADRTFRAVYTTSHYVSREEESGGFFASRSPEISHGICLWGEEETTTRLDREAALPTDWPQGHGFGPLVQFTGVENAFFANVLAPAGEAARCAIRATERGQDLSDPEGSLFEVALKYDRVELAGGAEWTSRTMAYVGPKDHDALIAAGHHLEEVVDLGWFAAVAGWLVALLRYIYGFVGNWGVAIIVMTVLIRLVLFPLTWKSFQSMAKMRVLKPEMDRINEEYGDNRELKGQAVMELYRKHKINPLGGCLPQLLQMPVWFAFYASLSTNVELYHASFALWWTDLSAPDPYFTLPLLLGGLMHFQQRITPTAMDPVQQKMMMYFMPIMITAFMLFLPAGLCLYMVTNSVLGIGQQQWIHRSLDRKEARSEGTAEGSDAAEDETGTSEPSSGDSGSIVSRAKPRKKATKRRPRRARS